MAKGKERRKHKRIAGEFSIRLGPDEAPSDEMATSGMNISMGGVYCEVPYYLPIMTKLAATLVLPMRSSGREEVLETEMIVVWSEPEAEIPGCKSYQIGCAFLPMDEGRTDLLSRYIDSTTGEVAGEAVQ